MVPVLPLLNNLVDKTLTATRAVVTLITLCTGLAWAEDTPAPPVFYPPMPDSPRIQHLVSFTGERDLAGANSSFASFVLGDAPSSQQLMQPYGVAIYGHRMYVADTGAAGIAIFDLEKKKFSLFPGVGAGRLKRPINIRIDKDGTKYVTDTLRDQIIVFDSNDKYLNTFGTIGQFRPIDVAIGNDHLFVTDLNHHQIHVLDKKTGKTIRLFGKAGSGEGELFHPTNITLGPDGDLYVVETSNYRIQRFTQEGRFVKTYGTAGNEPGSFARPKGIAMDRSGRMYVGDAAFENVQLFDAEGKLLLYFGQPGEDSSRLNLPAGVSIDYESVAIFQRYADPKFALEYVIFVASQFGPNKVDVFGFGRMEGMEYPADATAKTTALH